MPVTAAQPAPPPIPAKEIFRELAALPLADEAPLRHAWICTLAHLEGDHCRIADAGFMILDRAMKKLVAAIRGLRADQHYLSRDLKKYIAEMSGTIDQLADDADWTGAISARLFVLLDHKKAEIDHDAYKQIERQRGNRFV